MDPKASAWFVGEGSLLIQAATIWRELGHSVVGVASSDTGIRGWAEEQGVPVIAPDAFVSGARKTPFDYLFSVVNLTLLGDEALALPKKLAVNFHDGYLPRYAGVNATVWALLNGESTHGVTWHEMTSAVNEGRILAQRAFDVSADETAFSLNAKCFTAGIETFRELAEHITSGTLSPTPQNLAERSYFGFYERPPHAMVLGFDAPAEELVRTVRALDFGAYPNPVGTPKILLENEFLAVSDPEIAESAAGGPPGTVLSVDEDGLLIATATEPLRFGRVRSSDGVTLGVDALARLGIRTGTALSIPTADFRERLTAAYAEAAKSEGSIVRLLSSASPLTLPLGAGGQGEPAGLHRARVTLPPGADGRSLPGLFLLFLARKTGVGSFDVTLANPALREKSGIAPALFASEIPLRVTVALHESISSGLARVDEACKYASGRFPQARDLWLRRPELVRRTSPLSLLVDVPLEGPLPAGDLALLFDTRSPGVELCARADHADAEALGRLARGFELFLSGVGDPGAVLERVPLVSELDKNRILGEWNATVRPVPEDECVHARFEAEAQKTPDRVAVTARGKSLTYRELDRRSNALAHELKRRGAGPDKLVGIFVERSVNLVVAILGVHKAGAAYVPLDPRYPPERIRFMIEDAHVAVVVVDRATRAALSDAAPSYFVIDDGSFDAGAEAPESSTKSTDLAYVIYTSGSTGKPKGVMVEHRNVVNFLCAMDDVLHEHRSGTWLAVTSLSFDISVLEIYWTLTRGLQLVLYAGDSSAAPPARKVDFSVFYFSSEESGGGPEHYRLLFEGARFADEHGFSAVWTPERHFHAFGGLYPNPAVTSAALAMVTKRVQLRAGSCVSPLHSPLRVAEEWSLVDNLSNGRVGISFASGWQPNDFAIRPEAFARRREQMLEDIEAIRRLWRGERLPFKNGNGKDVSLGTLPRPVQPELPVWVTAAGTPETFEAAGRIGANLLTHLLGQTFAEVGQKVRAYRAAWEKAGHPGRGVVTLMLHTFVGSDRAMVKEAVRKPMKEYLKSAVGLIKEAAWSFPTFKQRIDQGTFSTDQLSPEEMDALLDHAFERYYATSGLFGTVDDALEVVDQVREIDVDEIACLIDFGVSTDQVLAHLPLLGVVLERSQSAREHAAGETLGDLFEAHPITHFQCTPSMASLLVQDEKTTAGLARLDAMLVGGEALPPSLARQLRSIVPRVFVNVYGPTETTVWSSSHRLDSIGDDVPIGRPLANTDLLVLDAVGELVPPGDEGELVIGGKGVTRGYLGREELTRERFVPHPFREHERVYRTGDLASFDNEGVLHFRGRLDQQVKIRGYRIEIGEIEARLGEHPTVRECAVAAREDTPGDKRLVGYVVSRGRASAPAELRAYLLEKLPEYMVPSAFVFLGSLPQTPNKKVDKKALPKPERERASARPAASATAPRSTVEELIAGIWREVLNLGEVGTNENFFDLGGHSLLTIQVLGKLKPKVARPLTLVDLFRFPTIGSLASFLESEETPASGLGESAARGAERQRIRRAMVERRRRE